MSLENKSPIFELYAPKAPSIGVLSIPHSGEELPDSFRPYLTNSTQDLMQDVDYRVNELVNIEELNNHGIAVIKSNIIRVAIDLNRSEDKCFLNWKMNSHGVQIVELEATHEAEQELIQTYYAPYYEVMTAMINDLKSRTKIASFIDLHSMPSKPTAYHFKQNPNQKNYRPDFCLSDDHGDTCEPSYITRVKELLESQYSSVLINDPYIGGYITKYVNTISQVNNIQIEINRGIYMDETNKKLIPEKVNKLKPALTDSLINTFEHFWNLYKK